MNPCKIVQDLLPLYVENVCSDSSREYVEMHLSECAECQSLLGTMNKRTPRIDSQKNAKKSFADFKRKMMLRRIGWAAASLVLCAVLYIALVFAPFMNAQRPIPIGNISHSVSRLSDGSVYITLESTRFPVATYFEYTYLLPEDPYTLCIRCYHTYNNDFNLFPFSTNRRSAHHIVITDESAPKYELNLNYGKYDDVIRKIVLLDADGERVLWQQGDSLPPAAEDAEARLQYETERGYLVPVKEQ